jgi:hypothetical protein
MNMGLSDREKKIIEEMEAALQAEDPKLVATMERSRPSMVYNFAAIIIGLALLYRDHWFHNCARRGCDHQGCTSYVWLQGR